MLIITALDEAKNFITSQVELPRNVEMYTMRLLLSAAARLSVVCTYSLRNKREARNEGGVVGS